MTRLWMRNLTSRNDSRTGACDMSRWGGAAVGVPGPLGPPGATGNPGDAGAGPEPGRALSIRFSSDIASTPYRPTRLTTADEIIGMRTTTSSGPPYLRAAAQCAHRRRPGPGE